MAQELLSNPQRKGKARGGGTIGRKRERRGRDRRRERDRRDKEVGGIKRKKGKRRRLMGLQERWKDRDRRNTRGERHRIWGPGGEY